MISSKRQKRFSQNQKQADEIVNRQIRLSFFNKLTQKLPTKVGGAAISALVVLHFVSQFIFFQNDYVRDEIAPPEIKREQIVEVKEITLEPETVKPDVVINPEQGFDAPIIVQPESKEDSPLKTVKKKQPRETKAERLRRAERLLTGV